MSRQPGAPSNASVASMRANAELGAVGQSKRYMWQMPLNRDKSGNEFPIVPTPHDPYDNVANIKAGFAQGDVGPNWMVPFQESDAQYLLRKRDAEEKAEFDSWVMQKFNIADPSQNMMLQSIAPELFQRREEVIDANQELVSRYAKLRLRGPKSIDDLRFEWLVETKRVDLPKGPIWDPEQWRRKTFGLADDYNAGTIADDRTKNIRRYQRGLFSPLKWLVRDDAAWKPNTRNRADIRGDPTQPFTNNNTPYPSAAEFRNLWTGYPTVYPFAAGNVRPGADPQEANFQANNTADMRAVDAAP